MQGARPSAAGEAQACALERGILLFKLLGNLHAPSAELPEVPPAHHPEQNRGPQSFPLEAHHLCQPITHRVSTMQQCSHRLARKP